MTEAARDHDANVDCHGYGKRPTFSRLYGSAPSACWLSAEGITKGGLSDSVLGYFAVYAAGCFSAQLG